MLKLSGSFVVLFMILASNAYSQPLTFDETGIQTIRQNGFEKVESKRRYGRGIEKLQFYPVGFSKKGAFAYMIYTDEDVIGLWKLVITDLVHDKQLALVSQEDPEYTTNLKQFIS
ncbi:MAG: hypothetical protein JRJ87_26630, partial [Deltaproteobacteria bacterium]|nr:hypothetical protein [Deltaproteobacteria bacterium]